MNQIKARVYYLIATGEVIARTYEMLCSAKQPTKEDDMLFYPELKGINANDVDFIELEYGTLSSTFDFAISYAINLETKTLDCVYSTQEELDAKAKEQIILQEAQQESAERVSSILEYIQNQDSQAISNIEDYILTTEMNKILNGGM